MMMLMTMRLKIMQMALATGDRDRMMTKVVHSIYNTPNILHSSSHNLVILVWPLPPGHCIKSSTEAFYVAAANGHMAWHLSDSLTKWNQLAQFLLNSSLLRLPRLPEMEFALGSCLCECRTRANSNHHPECCELLTQNSNTARRFHDRNKMPFFRVAIFGIPNKGMSVPSHTMSSDRTPPLCSPPWKTTSSYLWLWVKVLRQHVTISCLSVSRSWWIAYYDPRRTRTRVNTYTHTHRHAKTHSRSRKWHIGWKRTKNINTLFVATIKATLPSFGWLNDTTQVPV